MLEKDTYRISVSTIKKTVTISVGELTSQEAAQRFMEEYQTKTSVLRAADYVLEVDCKDMKVVTPELAGSLEAAFRLYEKTGFKLVRFQISGNTVLKMQFNRIAKLAGLNNIEIVQGGN